MRVQGIAGALLALFCAWSHAQTAPEKNACAASSALSSAEAARKAGLELPVFKRYCYDDKAGSHVLLLAEKQDRPFPRETLSTAIQAALYKVSADGAVAREWIIRDFADKDEAGVNFRSKLMELSDLDGDGLVDPVLVYRFFNGSGSDVDTGAFSGRLKIVVFHQGRKATIHAITGDLDGDRRTTANDNFFALPRRVQQHLARKMAGMYESGAFGFDNPEGFMPKKERGR